ncbi:MAG: hypothetical protein DIU80_007635 [Chloroflexota bacterium]
MTWYADLEPCTYFPDASDRLLAVGWLEQEHPYTRGQASPAVIDRFAELLQTQGTHFPAGCLGLHTCSLCPDAPDAHRVIPPYTHRNGRRISLGVTNLFVPGNGVVYVAPSLALHYMVEHEYLPPQEFCDALLSCPPIGSAEYYRLFEQNGPACWREWARRRGMPE